MQLSIGQKIASGFGLALVALVVVGAASFNSVGSLVTSVALITHTAEMTKEISDLRSAFQDCETGERGFVVTGQESFLEPFQNGKISVKSHIETIKNLTKSPDILRRLSPLETLASSHLAFLESVIDARRNKGFDEAKALIDSGQGKKYMDEVLRLFGEMENTEIDLASERQDAADRNAQGTKSLIIWGTVLASAIVVVAGILITRSVTGPLGEAINNISTSSTEIAATIEQHERMASSQAASVNETTTTMDELAASFRQSSEVAEGASNNARQAIGVAEDGTETVRQTIAAMTNLKGKVRAIAEQILRLSEQTSQIGSITNLVSDIANRTNMLALNASVEAARAGEHGKGFGVVAVEIRKLADQSRTSAEKINTLIADIQNATNSTVMVTEEGTKTVEEGEKLAHRTAEMFSGLTNSLNVSFDSAEQTALGIKQQLLAIRQVTDAMEAITIGARETSTGISQTKIGIDKMREAAVTLKSIM